MTIQYNNKTLNEVRALAIKHSINLNYFSNNDIQVFLNILDKAIKKVNNN